jgi:Mannosyl oligosaccharide glucosidase.
MDNIGCFDRDKTLPNGALLEQSDGTSWMALFCITMLSIAVELARHEPFYQKMALKYFEHFLYIAHAMTNMDGEGVDLWDAEDEFFYDVIHLTNGQNIPLKLHSMVGLVPLFAVLAAPSPKSDKLPSFAEQAKWFLQHRPDLLQNVAPVGTPGKDNLQLLAILSRDRLVAVLRRMLDSEEFLSDYGVRALSRYHLEHPYVFNAGGQKVLVKYLPAESDNRLFGGNSNWRGPIWFPVNYMLVRSLHEFWRYYGDTLKVECPTGSGKDVQLERSGRRAHAPLEPDLSARPGTWQPPRGVWRQRLLPERSALARPHTVSRILQRRQRRGARCQPSDRLDRANRVAAVRVRGAKGRCLARPPGDRIRLALRFAPRVFTSASIRNMPPRSSSRCSTIEPMPTRPTSSA